MPIYYFDVRNSFGFASDEEGKELASFDEARAVAMEAARSLISADVKEGRLDLNGTIEILDEQRQPITTISFAEAVTFQQVQQRDYDQQADQK